MWRQQQQRLPEIAAGELNGGSSHGTSSYWQNSTNARLACWEFFDQQYACCKLKQLSIVLLLLLLACSTAGVCCTA
jgi:hypothetical protein